MKRKPVSQASWEKSDQYKIAVLTKVVRAMKSYGYNQWMTEELKKVGISL